MAALGGRSMQRLVGCKAITISRAEQLALLATGIGIDFGIAADGGFRTPARQQELIDERDAAVAAGEPSYAVAPVNKAHHTTGDAFDIEIDAHPDTMTDEEAYKAVADLAPSVGLRAGYYFSTRDEFHFENAEPWTPLVGSSTPDDSEGPVSDATGAPTGAASPEAVAAILALTAVGLYLAFR